MHGEITDITTVIEFIEITDLLPVVSTG